MKVWLNPSCSYQSHVQSHVFFFWAKPVFVLPKIKRYTTNLFSTSLDSRQRWELLLALPTWRSFSIIPKSHFDKNTIKLFAMKSFIVYILGVKKIAQWNPVMLFGGGSNCPMETWFCFIIFFILKWYTMKVCFHCILCWKI